MCIRDRSTDAAHSLSDSFDVKLKNEPTKIFKNLSGMEIDTVLENERIWAVYYTHLFSYLFKPVIFI